MQVSLEGKVALVTGGSKGIGKAIAAGMAGAGARVVISSRKIEQLEAAADEIMAEYPDSEVMCVAANAGDIDAAVTTVAAAVERFGRLDILVNNAATNPHYGNVLDIEPSKFDKTFEVNVKGPLYWSKAAVEAFGEGGGVIINIASVGGLIAERGLGVYNLTKATLMHLTKQLAHEIGPSRAVCIAPGLVKTDFAQVLVDSYGTELAAELPVGRLGEPHDVGSLAVFLASDAASWITGQTYVIDGGALVR